MSIVRDAKVSSKLRYAKVSSQIPGVNNAVISGDTEININVETSGHYEADVSSKSKVSRNAAVRSKAEVRNKEVVRNKTEVRSKLYLCSPASAIYCATVFAGNDYHYPLWL